jgi:hypothetical protein
MATIQLSQGKTAIVDDSDLKLLSRFTWYARKCSGRFYAVTAENVGGGKTQSTYMHRLLTQAPSSVVVDHRNGNTLDNRRGNFRLCSQAQNVCNRRANKGKRFKGVTLLSGKNAGRFLARIQYQRKSYSLGIFDTAEDAARSYDAKARELFGEFANFNFPDTEKLFVKEL